MTSPSAPAGPPDPRPSWEDIARSHGRFLYTVAYRLTGNREDAEDLVQDVLLRVRRGLDNYRPGNLEGWLSTIASNLFLDEVRRRRRRPLTTVADIPEPLLGVVVDPEAEIAKAKLSDEMQAALAKVSDDFRVAVVMCDVVGMDYEEIAIALSVPVGTVRSRIHRGRGQLRDVLSRNRS